MKQRDKKILIGIVVLVVLVVIFNMLASDTKKVLLNTNYGDVTLEIYTSQMPITGGNFVKLVNQGFYDGVIFHRVLDGFVIQGGDPTGTGTGGPGYKIKDEFTNTDLDKNLQYTLSMANAGPNTGGSQFFINLADNYWLNGKHPVFGKVVDGFEVVDKIAKVKVNSPNEGRPLEEVKIISAKVL